MTQQVDITSRYKRPITVGVWVLVLGALITIIGVGKMIGTSEYNTEVAQLESTMGGMDASGGFQPDGWTVVVTVLGGVTLIGGLITLIYGLAVMAGVKSRA